MNEILLQVNRMVGCIGAEVDITDCNNNGFNEVKKKLYIIERYLVANKTVRVLEECVKDLKDVCDEKKDEQEAHGDDKREDFIDSKSIKDIENAGDFEYKAEAVVCMVCDKKAASYSADQDDDFYGKIQSRVFVSLKSALKKHLRRHGHQEKLKNGQV